MFREMPSSPAPLPRRPKVVCAVVIAHVPRSSAGNTWAFLQWALGLRQAGCDVWIVEHMDRAKLEADPEAAPGAPSLNERLWAEVAAEWGFEDCATLFLDDDAPSAEAFTRWAEDADAFLNLSGQFKLAHRVARIARRAYLDMDPGFTQLWAAVSGVDMNFEPHSHFFTVGALLPQAHLPATGREWIPTLPPVCLDQWRTAEPGPLPVDPAGCWTTVTHWHGYKQFPWDGRLYGDKRDSLVRVRDLPGLLGEPPRVLVATDMTPDWHDHREFSTAGWRFAPAAAVCADLRVYRRFLAASAGEFSVAKQGYVVSRGGWFSDRAACYLALGRPVALEETGWSEALPSGDGLRAWTSVEEAAEALVEFERDPARHQAAARRIAEEFLDARKVCAAFLRALGLDLSVA